MINAAAFQCISHDECLSQTTEQFETCATCADMAQVQRTLEDLAGVQEEIRKSMHFHHESLTERLEELLLHLGHPSYRGSEKGRTEFESQEGVAAAPSHSEDFVAYAGTLVSKFPSSLRNLHDVRVEEDKGAVNTPPDKDKPRSWAARVALHPWFDLCAGALIVLNFMAIFVELEWRGYDNAHRLNIREDNQDWAGAQKGFVAIERVFVVLYNLELLLRIRAFRADFLRDVLNVTDAVVVVLTTLDSFVLESLSDERSSSSRVVVLARMIRITRALRLARFLRILRLMGMFSALRVLVKTLATSWDSLLWSMVVVGFIVVAAAMLMVQLVSDVIADPEQSEDLRTWCFKYYGSMFRASYTMFEATFSGVWATSLSRPLVEEVHSAFSLFWLLYIITVNFAVMRVIAALFLKQTMDVARIDAERMAYAKMQERESVLETLREIFQMGDTEGDGVLHRWEFEQMMEVNKVVRRFKSIELEAPELLTLFNLLSEDDGVVDQEEFIAGCLKLRNNVRTVDMIQVIHEQMLLRRSIEQVKEGIERMDTVLHPKSPWKARRNSRMDLTRENVAARQLEDTI